jgi:hypothetical protein
MNVAGHVVEADEKDFSEIKIFADCSLNFCFLHRKKSTRTGLFVTLGLDAECRALNRKSLSIARTAEHS